MGKPRTLGELKKSGYRVFPVKEEMRRNLIEKLRGRETLFPEVIGYEESVIPLVENAVLAGHNMIFLGERGQAKSRIIRSLLGLLDEKVPAVEGCEVHCNPFRVICRRCRERSAEMGDDLPLMWIGREERFGEKLATPDVTIPDLFGEVDPIKVSEGRYLSDELTIHYGLIPRTNRGIFAINELPDLGEKIQVGLFNVMEEGDLQIRGYRIRLPLDIVLVASANPEDYTSRGRIITPLKDRFQAQIRTHYPVSPEVEIEIMDQECLRTRQWGRFAREYEYRMPRFMKEIVAEITFQARSSPKISQRSGVSVRVSVANYESLLAFAEKRAITGGENPFAPRISDLEAVVASTEGKIELEYAGEEVRESELVRELVKRAVQKVFHRYFEPASLGGITEDFNRGAVVEVASDMPSSQYLPLAAEIGGMEELIKKLGADECPATRAAGVEFILEGLHLDRKLNKSVKRGKVVYQR